MSEETETLRYKGKDGYLKLLAIIIEMGKKGYTVLTLSKEELETDKERVVIHIGTARWFNAYFVARFLQYGVRILPLQQDIRGLVRGPI